MSFPMINIFALISILLLPNAVVAGGLPKNTNITVSNASLFSINVQRLESGDSENNLYQVSFPATLKECAIGRVQTTLLNSGIEVSSSSMDYKVGSPEPNLLLHFLASEYDMAVTLQYCCTESMNPGCKYSLSINSLKGWLVGATSS